MKGLMKVFSSGLEMWRRWSSRKIGGSIYDVGGTADHYSFRKNVAPPIEAIKYCSVDLGFVLRV